MRDDIVGQHQHRGLAGLREVARDAVHEVGPHTVKVVQILLDGRHRHVTPAREELLGRDVLAGLVHEIRLVRPVPDRLAQDRRDDALRCALHQLHRERATDAVAEEGELADAEMVHQAELVVGEGVPGIGDRDRTGGLAVRGVSLIHGDHAEVVLEFLHDVDHRVRPVDHARVQAAAGRRQQREARACLGVADADIALLVESDLEGSPASSAGRLPAALVRIPRRGGCRGGSGTG